MRDLACIPALNQAGEEKFVEAKKLIKGESEEKKENFIKKEVEKLEIKGIDGEKAEKIIRQKVEKNILLPDDEIFDNNNVGIKVEQLLINPEKYNGLYIKDPLEPEKGSCKAIVNSIRLNNINIYSYLHGGFRYEIRPDYSFVLKQATNTYSATPEINEVNVLKIKELCRCARLLDSEIRNIAHILKKNKV